MNERFTTVKQLSRVHNEISLQIATVLYSKSYFMQPDLQETADLFQAS